MEQLKRKKILVIGGAGFIGSHLVERLIALESRVSVIDIKINSQSYFSVKKLKKHVLYSKIDITDKKRLFSYLKRNTFDYIVHLAAEPIVENAYKDPEKAFQTNITGTINVLEAVRMLKKVKGVIIASSDKAYGKTKKAYTEESPLQGDHPYDVSKSCADLIAQSYYRTYGTPIVITRFGNVYGEGDTYFNRIIPGICVSISKKKKLQIRSDGKYVRDYLYVKDVAEGYVFLLQNFQKLQGDAFNFSSKDTYSVIDLVKKAENILDITIPYTILNNAKNEIPYQHLNDSKIRKFGWKNKYCLNDTLPAIVDWYKSVV